jgi:hypothetical protein
MSLPLPKTQLKNWYAAWPGDLWTYLVSLVAAITATVVPTPLVLPIVTPASNALPTRPAGVPGPADFLAEPSGNLTGATTYTLQVGGAYKPGDIVKLMFTAAQLATHNVIVIDGGAGAPTIGTILGSAASFGYLVAQLNAAGTHWVAVGGGTL